MPAGEFRESAASRKSRLRTAAVRMPRYNDSRARAPARTISAVLKYRCSEQETIAGLNDVEIVQFAPGIVALYRCTNPRR